MESEPPGKLLQINTHTLLHTYVYMYNLWYKLVDNQSRNSAYLGKTLQVCYRQPIACRISTVSFTKLGNKCFLRSTLFYQWINLIPLVILNKALNNWWRPVRNGKHTHSKNSLIHTPVEPQDNDKPLIQNYLRVAVVILLSLALQNNNKL